MAKPRSGVFAALDVGSSKIVCLVATQRPEGGIRITGVGHRTSQGVKSGSIVDMEAAEAAILTAVGAAEEMAGERLHSLVAGVSAGKPASRTMGMEVEIDGHEVDDADLRRIHIQGAALNEDAGREIIHCIPVSYNIDGNGGIRNPRGLAGQRLGVDIHLVTADASALKNLAACISRCHLDVDSFVVTPYAAGLACLEEDDIALGATVIDMGAGTTSVAVFENGQLVHADVVPVGGAHVTLDIARGLSTPLAHADRMKALYGSAIPSPSYEMELIDVPVVGEESRVQPNHVPRSILVGIIRPRLEETFELVRARLQASGAAKLAGLRIVLTGGASQLPGARELATLMLDNKVRMGRPMRMSGLAEAASGPAFSAVAGLLKFAAERLDDPGSRGHAASAPGGRLGRFGQWLRESIQ